MRPEQDLWWRQAVSDHALFVHLRRGSWAECHRLHYLQMATEKLSKAYFWRVGHAPPRTHTGFARFLRALLSRRPNELDRIANVFGFHRVEDLETWVRQVLPLAAEVQNIAPAEAGDGPNPEYPWPHQAPANCPADHRFGLWVGLSETGRGRKLLAFIGEAIARFPEYA